MSLDREKVSLGITPTLWSNDDFPLIDIGVSFEQCISEMALAGFEGCSVGHKYPKDPATLLAALELRGLKVSEPWTSTYFTAVDMEEATLEAFAQTLQFIKALGGTDMVVAELGGSAHPLPVAVFSNAATFSNAQWPALCSGMKKIGGITK